MSARHSRLRSFTKALRHVRGGMLLGEHLRRRVRTSNRSISIADFDGDLRMLLDLTEHMQNRIYWYGYYSLDLVPLLKRVLRAGDVVIDCGANVGEISLVARNAVGDSGQVFAFEPMPRVADRLQANVDSNGFLNVVVIRKGVAREAGYAPIYEAAEKSEDGLWNKGLGTLYSNDERPCAAATIELTSLDAFVIERQLSRVDLLKIDIEGGELAALQGARDILATFKPALVVELNEQMSAVAGYGMRDVLEFLEAMNYAVYRVGRRGGIAPLVSAHLRTFQNLYCVPR